MFWVVATRLRVVRLQSEEECLLPQHILRRRDRTFLPLRRTLYWRKCTPFMTSQDRNGLLWVWILFSVPAFTSAKTTAFVSRFNDRCVRRAHLVRDDDVTTWRHRSVIIEVGVYVCRRCALLLDVLRGGIAHCASDAILREDCRWRGGGWWHDSLSHERSVHSARNRRIPRGEMWASNQ